MTMSVEGIVSNTPVDSFFDLFAVHIDGPRAAEAHLT
jgi:hypothetical protein